MMKLFCSEENYRSRGAVAATYPSAAKIVKTFGGWMVFEFYADYLVWKKQK